MSEAMLDEICGAILRALRDDAQLSRLAHVMDDGRTARPPFPHLRLAEARTEHWGAKDRPGAELRCTLIVRDKGELGRIAAIGDAVRGALAAMPRVIGGWETSGVMLLETRRGWLSGGVEEMRMLLRIRALRQP